MSHSILTLEIWIQVNACVLFYCAINITICCTDISIQQVGKLTCDWHELPVGRVGKHCGTSVSTY